MASMPRKTKRHSTKSLTATSVYNIRVRVADGKVECWLDDKQMVDVDLKGKRISTRIEVDANRPLGCCCYNVESALKDIKLRRLEAK